MRPVHEPHPFREFVVKVHGRCDLACDHCFVYRGVDQRWTHRPAVMSGPTADAVAARIAEHVRAHDLDEVTVVLHGGEPLLAGVRRLEHCVRAVRAAVTGTPDPATGGTVTGDVPVVRFRLQTNGVRLTAATLSALRALDIGIGISLDGDRSANDRHRRRHNGTSSYPDVVAALHRLGLPENRAAFTGILCTIDIANDPVTTYESLLQFAPPMLDFLLPVANWSAPPPGTRVERASAPYGEWLIAVFERWYSAPVRETRVRCFEEMLNVLLGGTSAVHGVGLSPAGSVVVETDGSIEVCDALTTTFSGAGATGLSVVDSSFDAVLATPTVVERQLGVAALADTCRRCPVLNTCGGGAHGHRYRAGSGFTNPSVYCPDLFATITHIERRLAADLAALSPATGG